ncbi:hypothetical protein NUW58_g4785 [Xylaria curta]|uniref:Uncharacterized protein n=1 Tax=Xylaria curta TaxID=42375 RepID=A0ACC1P7W3_9PEZI|nr:hypothetical protein NUW58_g4785 [Xylaria curta]
MTSVAEPVSPTEVPPSVDETVPPSPSRTECQEPPSPRSDVSDHGPERDSDSISIDSTQSVPDFSGRRMVTFDDDRMTTAYEAWELVCVEDRYTRQSWKSFCGINFVTRYVNHHDGCVYTNPVVSFDQGELADMHEDAISGYKHKLGTDQERAYEQDLANRVNDLPTDIYDQIQFLLDDKTHATNRNPYRRREWRVVVVQPGEFRMTELLPERKRQSLFSRKKQPPVTPTYSVVIRGQEVKSTKEDGGWKAHSRHSNPWWRLDNRETKEEREQHKDAVKKMNRAMDRRHQHPPPALRTRPVGPIRPPPRPAAGR